MAAASLVATPAARAQNLSATVTVGTNPNAVAVNPVTNRIYVANLGSSTVSVLNGVTSAVIATVPVGPWPVALAVNPVTNKIYVASNADGLGTGSVTVIDGASNTTSTLTPSTGEPEVIAVNPVTNKIYVGAYANGGLYPGSSVMVIDGSTNTFKTSVSGVSGPDAIAINPVTNSIYVANRGLLGANTSGAVTVIDGSVDAVTATVTLGNTTYTILDAIAVNPVTDQIYAVGGLIGTAGGELYVIDGASATCTATLQAYSGPHSIVVNPVTNKVFVTNETGELHAVTPPNATNIYPVTVYDGATAALVATVQVGSSSSAGVITGTVPYAMALNPTTNQLYVGNWNGGGSLTVIDGASYAASTITAGGSGTEAAITVNPVTNRIYVANYGGNVSVIDGTVTATATLPTGNFPLNMVLNPVTNKIYVVNFQNNNGTPGTVTVIDAKTNTVKTTVSTGIGIGAWAIDVNPVTNKIYVVNTGEVPFNGSVSVIDGTTDTVTATVAVGVSPNAVVVNPDTNKIFVTNYGYGSISGSVSVIDGAANTVSGTLGTRPYAIAVNTATNRVYLSNYHSVIVADGTTGATITTVATSSAGNIAVNRVTNKIYVLNNEDQYTSNGLDSCTVIDGATNTVLAAPGTQADPAAIAINPVTNMVYVVDQGYGTYGYVTVINGATNAAVGFVVTPQFPASIAVNPVTNKVYVGDFGAGGFAASSTATGNTVTVIDASNGNSTVNVTTGYGPEAVLVNPVTDAVYVLNEGVSQTGGGSVTVIGDSQVVPLNASVAPLAGNQTASPTPAFTFTAQSLFSPTAPPPKSVFFQVDSLTGPWTEASAGSSSFNGTTAALSPGLHTLYAYADDGQDSASTQLDSPLTGAVSVYEFVVTSPTTQLFLNAPTQVTAGTPFSVNVIPLDASGNPAIGYAGTVALTSSDSMATLPPASGSLASVGGSLSATLYGTPGVYVTTGETITATDTVTPSITGTMTGIRVSKVFTHVSVTPPNNPTYNGAPQGASVTTSPYGLGAAVVYTDLTAGTAATSTPPISAGYYEVSVTPNDPFNYFNPVIDYFWILQATPPITWATPAAVPNGTALSSTQLNATSTLPGSFSYSPAAGTVVNYPSQTITATFTPTDAVDYAAASIAATLTVNPPPSVAPVITAPPASQTVSPGAAVNFTVTASGFPVPAYQWYFNNAPIPGATGSTLNIPGAEPGTAGIYSVTATNSQGSVTSGVVGLAVVTGQFSGDPSLTQPGAMATDGVNLLVGGTNANALDPNRNGSSGKSVFLVPLPLGSGSATSLYPAVAPAGLAALGGDVFWIDPDSAPQSNTQILFAPEPAVGAVNPIYTGSPGSQPIAEGGGLATDGTLLYAADRADGAVWCLNTDGSGLAQIGPARYTGGATTGRLNTIAVDTGVLYIADTGGTGGAPAILGIATNGTAFTTIASGAPLVSPSGIAAGNGMIYVADPGANNTIWQIPESGGTPVALISNGPGTTIVRLGGLLYVNGSLFIADSGAGAIYQLQVVPQATPSINSPLTASGVLQSSFTYQVLASGGIGPYSYGVTGLPTGLAMTPSGQISGSPTQAGTFPVALTVTDSTNPVAQVASATLQLTIGAMDIAAPLSVTGSAGAYFNYQVNLSGGTQPYAYAATGLPAGLNLDPFGGNISGFPSQTGVFNVAVTVTDGATPANTAQAVLQVTINALGITSFNDLTAIVNDAFSFQVTPTGGMVPYLFSATGLPTGLGIGTTTGLITGTPIQAGEANATLSVSDASNPAIGAQQQLSVFIEAFGIPSPLFATGTVGTPFSFSAAASGGSPPYLYSSSPLPSGLTLNTATGVITGTPSESTYAWINVNVSDASLPANTAGSSLNIVINQGSATVTLTQGSLNQNATGSPLAAVATTSPSGLTVDFTYTGTGGTAYGPSSAAPTSPGTYTVGAVINDPNYQGSATGTLTINNNVPPAITSSLSAGGTYGLSFNYAITGNSAPSSYSATGLPGGLGVNTATGVISGAPTAAGTFNVTIGAINTAGTGTSTLVITVGKATATVALAAGSLTQNFTGSPLAVTATTTPSGLAVNFTYTGAGATTYATSSTAPAAAGTYTVNAVINDPNDQGSVSGTLTITRIASVVTSNLSAGATFGTAFNYAITGSYSPTSYSATGLPGGLTVNTTTGVISGIPAAAGTFDATIGATNAVGTGTAAFVITVAPGLLVPVISSSSQASGQVGITFSYTILANNSPTGFNATGLPAGLVLTATTGVISGTPTAAGSFSVLLTGSNAAGTGQTFALTLTMAAAANAPSITSSASATGKVNAAFTYGVTTSVAATSFAASGLPSGLLLNTATGVISGTPTAAGTTIVSVTATNATGAGAPLSLVIIIQPSASAPAITSSLTATGTQGQAFAYTITGTNTPTSFTATGLPSGLTLNATSGLLSGTPTAVGTTSVVLTASNASGTSAAVILVIAVNPVAAAPAITSGNTAGATIGTAFTYQITASPAATSYAVTGSPAWLGINTSTGLLSGTPTGAPGTVTVILNATNVAGTSAPFGLAITMNAAAGTPVVTSTASPAAVTAGVATTDTANGCLYQVLVLPGANIQYYYVTGGLPAGLSLDPVLGLIFGTPTVPGSYTFSVGAANLVGIGASAEVTLTINAAAGTPQITNTGGSGSSALSRDVVSAESYPTASGTVGAAFTGYQITASGSPTAYSASGLPPGLAVNPTTGLITGVPSTAGVYTVLVSATNSNGIGASTSLIITISPPLSAPTITSPPTDNGVAGTAYSYQVAASNSPTSYNASGLPTGLSLASTTGRITGVPTIPGVYSVSLSANNANGTGPSETLTLTIAAAVNAPAITSVSTATAAVGSAFTAYHLSASNGPITAYAALNLPPGLVMDTIAGTITGTPTVAGTYTAILTATNATGPSSPFALLITVSPASTSSAVTGPAIAGATSGAAFSYQITASNSPVSFNVTGLPSGLSVNTSTGVISGSVGVSGSYQVTISVNNATGTGASFTLTINVVNPGSYAYLNNLSARAYVGTGGNILIAGFGINGSGTKNLLLRGVGPGMFNTFQVPGALPSVQLAFYDGENPAKLITSNTGWANSPVTGNSPVSAVVNNATPTLMATLGAFSYATGSLDAALEVNVPSGSFTSQVIGQGSSPTGVALAEVYDADGGIPSATLINLSARVQVGTGFNVLIGGFSITGNTTEKVLIRGVGPGLTSTFQLTGTLATPLLQLYDSETPAKLIAQNSGWNTTPTIGNSPIVAIVATATANDMNTVGAFSLVQGSTDAAIVVTLPPGAYTAELSGVGGTTGIGLVEVYAMP